MGRRLPLLNFGLFFATIATTLIAGGLDQPETATLLQVARAGVPFCTTLLAILFVHEMGHYVVARIHRVDATLPYFIPVPFGPIGTLGAFIRIRSAMPSRTAVLDIGAAGPLAGFAVALPLLLWGFSQGEVVTGAATAASNTALQSPWSLLMALLSHTPIDESAASIPVMGDSIITLVATQLSHGALPPGADVRIGPVGFAAWIGMYVTTLNLIPIGQLDGGHVMYALFGARAERLSRLTSWALLGFGVFASWSWLVWWVLTRFVVGTRHPPATVEEPLTPARRLMAVVALVILAVTFVPVPFRA